MRALCQIDPDDRLTEVPGRSLRPYALKNTFLSSPPPSGELYASMCLEGSEEGES